MRDALEGTPEEPSIPPAGIVSVRIDLDSGKLSRKTDYTSDFEYFIQGTEPKEYATAPKMTATSLSKHRQKSCSSNSLFNTVC